MQENTQARELQVRRAAEDRHLWLRKVRFGSNTGEFSLVEMHGSRVFDGFEVIDDVDEWLKSTGANPVAPLAQPSPASPEQCK